MDIANRADDIINQARSWIVSQRWYGDKARTLEIVEPESVVPVAIDGKESALIVARFTYDVGPERRYFVPILIEEAARQGETERQLADALRDGTFIRWFVQGFADERTLAGETQWHWRRLVEDFPAMANIDFTNARVIAAEQSNTSVAIDGRFIGKVFRKLESGINPDLEIGEFLTSRGQFRHVPRLYGVVEVVLDGESTAVAALQQFVPNEGDGWRWLTTGLCNLNDGNRTDLIDAVALLGERTAGLHLALADDLVDDEFMPEPFTDQDAEDLIGRVIGEMEESVEGLAQRLNPPEVERLHKGLGMLMGGARSLVGSYKTRVHGDYHLGQTLRTVDGDFCLIDFEGEPSRPMSQRRMKTSPLKDVAGMLRSLDYAVASALVAMTDGEERQRICDWQEDANASFLTAYRDTVKHSQLPLVPPGDLEFRNGLNVLIAEKALYEVRYELNNRPDWVSIPLNGIRRLAGIPIPEA